MKNFVPSGFLVPTLLDLTYSLEGDSHMSAKQRRESSNICVLVASPLHLEIEQVERNDVLCSTVGSAVSGRTKWSVVLLEWLMSE